MTNSEGYKRCIIISGSPEIGTACIGKAVEVSASDLIIACDRGYNNAKRLGLKPHIVVGDFDSYEGDIEDIKSEQLEGSPDIIRVNAEKDDTDTMLAIKTGMEYGIRDFILLEALGGRLDHTLANIAAAVYVINNNADCRIISDREIIYVLQNNKLILNYDAGTTVSVFSYSDKSSGVSYDGLKYPLLNAELTNLFPLGISNEFISETAVIEVREGILVILIEKCERKVK